MISDAMLKYVMCHSPVKGMYDTVVIVEMITVNSVGKSTNMKSRPFPYISSFFDSALETCGYGSTTVLLHRYDFVTPFSVCPIMMMQLWDPPLQDDCSSSASSDHPHRNAYTPCADEFGISNLLQRIRTMDTHNPIIANLILGMDASALNMNSPNLFRRRETRYSTFGGPFIGSHTRMHDVPCKVPEEYRVSVLGKNVDPAGQSNALSPFQEKKYCDEILFHLFYNFCGEIYQLLAAVELYARSWRYHKQQQVWLTRSQFSVHQQSETHELAVYTVFDPTIWRKVNREMTIFFHDIEGKPDVPDMKDVLNVKT
uniref:NOT2_3_5 domain-containing protein n=1 Tax=Steinernema glaseri TaxID=37863 RepID=A0A1I8AK09_9BILA